MKSIPCILFFGLLALAACGQNNELDHFFTKYQSSGNGVTLSLDNPGSWLGSELSDNNQASRIAKKITGFHMLMLNEADLPSLKADLASLSGNLQKNNYDELVTLRKAGTFFRVLALTQGDLVTDMVMLMENPQEAMVIHIQGKLTRADMDSLENNMTSHSVTVNGKKLNGSGGDEGGDN